MGTVSIALVVQGGTIAVNILAAGPARPGRRRRVPQRPADARASRCSCSRRCWPRCCPSCRTWPASGHYDEFLGGLRRLVLAILGFGVVATIGPPCSGPTVIAHGLRRRLGPDRAGPGPAGRRLHPDHGHHLPRPGPHRPARPQPHGHRLARGPGVFVGVTALGEDLFLRVELGLLAGSPVGLRVDGRCASGSGCATTPEPTRSTWGSRSPRCRWTCDGDAARPGDRPGVPRRARGTLLP